MLVRITAKKEESDINIMSGGNEYRILFEKSPESMLVVDTAGRITQFNESAHRHLGYSREEFAKLGVLDIDPFEDKEGMQAKIERVLREGKAEFDVRQRTKDGVLKDTRVLTQTISLSGRTVLQTVWRDITDMKSSMEALRRALAQAKDDKEKAEAIIASIEDGISIHSTDFRVLYQNQASRDFIGSLVGKYCYSAYEHKDRICEGCPLITSFKNGKTHTATRAAATDDGVSYFEITASALLGTDGQVVAAIEVARDITQRWKAEGAISRRINELIRAPEDLILAVRNVYEAGKYLYPSLSPHSVPDSAGDYTILPHETLSKRELQVMLMIASGKSGKKIADELSVSPKTIATFRTRILKKMRMTGNDQLIKYAIKNGLLY
jgi:PAS domain S-box-containing protein